ncbi:helix-turn-helix transcriptional regulator [Nocardioides dongxiaopingii]|uniref:helix-turn-helix transcriptional regulator n=1 Tax=Nocardioides sp. S-1144 TaxID=2582905 RepID=UPI0021CB52E6|nr:WYL domain-containing protein [Nocardioides sp. S-1144]
MPDPLLDDVGPTARALVALELIHDRPGVSGEHLARRLGVSTRAARRYVGILREAGIPVESTPGRYGGYRIGRGFRVPPLMFSTDQALALVMAAVRGRSAVGGATAVEEALDKIIRVLPAALAEPAEALRLVGTTDSGAGGPDPHLASALARAAHDGVRVRLRYRSRPEADPRSMDVDPWGVNLRHDRWYLLCWSHSVDERAVDAKRVLRIDRIEACTPRPETFTPPNGLDVAAVVDEHMAEGWGADVSVLVEAPVADVARRLPRHLGRLEEVDEDHTRLIGSMDDPAWFALQLIRLAAPFVVEQPDELRAACRRIGERFLAAGS